MSTFVALDSVVNGRDASDLIIDNDESLICRDQLRHGFGDINVGFHFVDKASAVLLNQDAVVHHNRRIRTGRSMDRTAMELIHVDVHRVERHRERNIFTGADSRTAKRHPGGVAAHVAGHHFLIGMESTSRNYNAAFCDKFRRFLIVDHHFAASAPKYIVMSELNDLGIEVDRNAQFLGGIQHLLRKLSASGAKRTIDYVTALQHRPDFFF